MRTWMFVLATLAAMVVACADSGNAGRRDGADVGSVRLVGETAQGLRLRVELAGDRKVRLRIPTYCSSDGRTPTDSFVSLRQRWFETKVDGDGHFTVDESYEVDGSDGDEEHIEMRIEGDVADDGSAAGTLEATSRGWNGQAREFGPDCETGTVAWAADRLLVQGKDLVVPIAKPMSLASAGPDLVAGTESGEVVHVDTATGEARRLEGAASAGPTTAADPSAPPTAAAGPGTAPLGGSMGPGEVAVVADGVWTVDPATGAVGRIELADGTRTATIDQPLDRMVAGPDALWTVSTNAFRSGYSLDRRDPVTGVVLASAPLERGAVAIGPSGVWYVASTLAGGRLFPVDPATAVIGEPFAVEIPSWGDAPVVTDDRIWWLREQLLMSIEPASGRVASVDLPSDVDALAGDATGVWTTHGREAVVRRIEGDRVVRTVDIPEGAWDVAVTADGAVWLAGRGAAGDEARVVRLDPSVTGG